MRVLLIEDDENKQSQLMLFLAQVLPGWSVSTAASFHSGLRRLISQYFDLLLLDMTMPTFDVSSAERGGFIQGYGGQEILEEMDRRDIVIPVIVVTQFDRFGDHRGALTLEELDKRLAGEYPLIYRGAVYYNSAREGWRSELRGKIMDAGIVLP